jgi:predicted GNAT family N-acyltransferase
MSHSDSNIVQEARTPDALEQARSIRHQVFVAEQGIPAELVDDGLDVSALHVLALHDGAPAATGRLTRSSEREGVLARIAVLPAYRGTGLGGRVVQCLEELARRESLAMLSLTPHHYLARFYGRLGYEAVPGSSTSVGYHALITMVKTLA